MSHDLLVQMPIFNLLMGLATLSSLAEPLFCSPSISACSRKIRHESSKVFVEHALHVARIQFRAKA